MPGFTGPFNRRAGDGSNFTTFNTPASEFTSFTAPLGAAITPTFDWNYTTQGTLQGAETFTRASTGTYFDASGTLQTAAINVPRFDYDPVTLQAKGLLIESTSTNSIRNNTNQGAVVSGALPTNWGVVNANGLTTTVAGLGTEFGMPYIDLTISGTTTGVGSYQLRLETTTGIAALTGDIWTESFYARLVGGSTANFNFFRVSINENTNVGSFVAGGSQDYSPSALTATLARFVYTRTLSGGVTVAALQPMLAINVTGAVAISCTIRVYGAQAEKLGGPTSVILTSGATVTRALDVANINSLASIGFNTAQGSIIAEGVFAFADTATQQLIEISDGTTSNRLVISGSSSIISGAVVAAGSAVFNQTLNSSRTAGTIYKCGLTYNTNSFTGCVNAGTVLSTSTGAVPTGMTTLYIGENPGGVRAIQGWVRRITYYPTQLTNAQLQTITT